MNGSLFGRTPVILITDNMERVVLPSSMMGALRRARDFGRRAGNISSNHPLNTLVETAVTLPGAVSLAPMEHERPDALFAKVTPKDGKIGESDSCPICLGKWEEDDDIVVSRCSHAFHKACIRGWVMPENRKDASNRRNCPMCRTQL